LQERALGLSKTYGIKVGFEARFSFVEDELSDMIDRHKADVLVLGMRARTLEQDLMGNTTTAAIKKLKFPVLAVPIGAKFGEIKKILFACDVLRGVPEKILKRIKELAASLNAEIEVFHVNNAIEEMKADHPALSSKDGIGSGLSGVSYYYKNVKSNEVIKEIEKEIKEFKADLLIMIPNKYGFWASLVHRSKTRVMASGLDIPLFSIPI
jgi:nucleotide-binding universal stress UspA family protein